MKHLVVNEPDDDWETFDISIFFYVYLSFLSLNFHESEGSRGKGRPILTPNYHFHPLHEHLDICWGLLQRNYLWVQLVTGLKTLVSQQKSLSTQLRALKMGKYSVKYHMGEYNVENVCQSTLQELLMLQFLCEEDDECEWKFLFTDLESL